MLSTWADGVLNSEDIVFPEDTHSLQGGKGKNVKRREGTGRPEDPGNDA